MGVRGDVMKHKQYHVWNPDNRDKVRRDVEGAAEKKRLEQEREELTNAENIYSELKARAGLPAVDAAGEEVERRGGISEIFQELPVQGSTEKKKPGFVEHWYDKTFQETFVKEVSVPDLRYAVNKGRQETPQWYNKLTDSEAQAEFSEKELAKRTAEDPLTAFGGKGERGTGEADPAAPQPPQPPRPSPPTPAPPPAPAAKGFKMFGSKISAQPTAPAPPLEKQVPQKPKEEPKYIVVKDKKKKKEKKEKREGKKKEKRRERSKKERQAEMQDLKDRMKQAEAMLAQLKREPRPATTA